MARTIPDVTPYAAVVLAGGAGRRLGGAAKPVLPVAGRPMLHRVLAAVADADPRVVVGPPGLPLPQGVIRTREHPPGGGPAVAAAAGLTGLPAGTGYVALLAADLPLLTAGAVAALRRAAAGPDVVGAMFVDRSGRRQWLCGVWRAGVLAGAVSAARPGTPLREMLRDLPVATLRADRDRPWYDCDTEDDLRQVEEWSDGDPG